MKYISVEQMHEACDNEYKENYAHGEYCHEQSFRWGFQEGIEFAKDYLEKLNNLLEQDEDIEINSVDELVEKFNNYGKD